MEADVRWKQPFENYGVALAQLRAAIQASANPSNLEKEGTIQRF